MKKLSVFVFLVCILLPGLSGCTTSGRMSMRERILNAAWHQRKIEKDQTIRSFEQTFNSWVGHPVSGVIRRMGPATQITDDEASGRIYIWVEHYQRTNHTPYLVVPPKQNTSTTRITIEQPQQTTTRGTMKWSPLFERWEYESETKPTYRPRINMDVPETGRTELPQLRFQKEIVTTTTSIMFYTRNNGTIYHWLIITPNNNRYAYNPRNAKNDTRSYSNRSLTEEEKRQYLDKIRKYDSTIFLFPDDAKTYCKRAYAKYELGLTNEAKQDLRTALKLATQQGNVKLKNSIEEMLRDLQ